MIKKTKKTKKRQPEPKFDKSTLEDVFGASYRVKEWEKQNKKKIKNAHEKLFSYKPGASKETKKDSFKKHKKELKNFLEKKNRKKKK